MQALLTRQLPERPEDWAFEFKWDGMRALVYLDGAGGLRIESRRGLDITARWPELGGLPEALPGRPALLDGELIALDGAGRPSFEVLQQRLGIQDPGAAARKARSIPAHLFLFDVLHLDGRALLGLPWTARREVLSGLGLEGAHWRVPPALAAEGEAMLAAARGRGLEGVIAKRLSSCYEPGRRSGAWRKVKLTRRQELVVGGWLPGEGGRTDRIGALLVGYYEDSRLRFAGRVGTGFTDRELARLKGLLAPLVRPSPPFDDPLRLPRAVWVEARLVAEVEFLEWTSQGRIRAPSYKGLREDKDPREVVREVAVPGG